MFFLSLFYFIFISCLSFVERRRSRKTKLGWAKKKRRVNDEKLDSNDRKKMVATERASNLLVMRNELTNAHISKAS